MMHDEDYRVAIVLLERSKELIEDGNIVAAINLLEAVLVLSPGSPMSHDAEALLKEHGAKE